MLRSVVALMLAVPAGLPAQIRASERSRLTQTIDGTVISLDYSRPKLRGRKTIFGSVVHWDEVWLVVRRAGPWTMVLDPDFHRFHEDRPDSNAAQIRFPVAALKASKTEVLTWTFPEIRVSGGTLAMDWAGVRVTMAVRVEPSYHIAMAEAEAVPLIGQWEFVWKADSGQKEVSLGLVLTYEKGSLYASFDPEEDYFGHFVLIRIADGGLIPGLFEKGEIYEVIRDMVLDFQGPKDRPESFEVRDDYDELIATGRRKH